MASEATSVAARRHTWSDFIALDEDDLRELIDGQLMEVEVPTKLHEAVVLFLGAVLFNWTRANGGLVLASGYKVRISDSRGVMPDIQVYREGHERLGGEHGLEAGAPDLVIEVVSPSSARYDRVVKLGWYAQIGVPEYWIVDPDQRTLERLVLDRGSYRIAAALTDDATFAPDSFPGVSIVLTELFTIPGE